MIKTSILSALILSGAAAYCEGASIMTDGQISKALVTLDEGEIEVGQMAEHHASKAAIKDFAKMMVNQHKDNKKATSELATKQKFTLDKSDLSRSIDSDGSKAKSDLKAAKKIDFDKTYVDQQITMHQQALTLLDSSLIPNAQSPELRDHLQKTRTAVNEHLEHAKMLQGQM